jgi:outer membrane protein OmpA-like peptidoglycan-associated protein/tetratricopeptide (TPR) repeat protein
MRWPFFLLLAAILPIFPAFSTPNFQIQKMTRILSLLLLLSVCSQAFAQKKFTTAKTANDKLKTVFDRGNRMFDLKQFDDAIGDFEKALKMDPTFIDAQIQWANTKNVLEKLEEAKTGYEKAIAIDSFYEPGVFYSLGIVEFELKNFERAAILMDYFLKKAPKISPSRRAAAKSYLENARFSAKAFANPVAYELKNLGPNINTPNDEYLPTLTADGENLVYCSVVKGNIFYQQEDFFISKLVDGQWQKGIPVQHLNTEENEGAQAISADGKLVVFTACNRQGSYGGCDLYYSETLNGKVMPVKNMGNVINTGKLESQPSLSPDGKTLYFVRGESGWKGNSDIWMSERLPNGKWGQPVRLDSTINTLEQEKSPFIHPDGQTLYFTSRGHVGMGDFDIFFSRKQPDGKWGKPENIGYPINTVGNEGAVFVSLDGSTAYISVTKEGGYGKSDIYSFTLHESARPKQVTYVKATVTDVASKQPLVANAEFVELTTGKVYASSTTDATGEFLVTLPAGGNYALNVSKEKYLFYSENFALTEPGTLDKPFKLAIALSPMTDAAATRPIVLKNIFFETGSATLQKESLPELAQLKKLLTENPTLKIQINGHTDNVGSDADNLRLSEARAKAVYDHLVQNGADASRLRYKGFGESVPAGSNDTEEGRRMNRRTEYLVVK